MGESGVKNLVSHSAKIGSNLDLVQGAGGNTSYKRGSVIWVKASGKRLKDALQQPIFAHLDVGNLSINEIVNSENFDNFCLNSLIPSIETNFHLLIKNSFVTHLHSLSSIALGVSNFDNKSFFKNHEIIEIPYFRPGSQLAKSIYEASPFKKNTLLLRNHGVIFSGESLDVIEDKIESFETNVQKHIGELAKCENCPGWIEILVSGVLTPDEAVFLGKKPFIESEAVVDQSIAINRVGDLIFPEGFSEDRINMANFYVRVAKMISNKTHISYLADSEVEFLLGWDKEIRRIEMAK